MDKHIFFRYVSILNMAKKLEFYKIISRKWDLRSTISCLTKKLSQKKSLEEKVSISEHKMPYQNRSQSQMLVPDVTYKLLIKSS